MKINKALLAIATAAALTACGGGGGGSVLGQVNQPDQGSNTPPPSTPPSIPPPSTLPTLPGDTPNFSFPGPAASCVEDFTMTPSATVSGAMEIGGRICNSVTLAAGTEYIVTDNIFVGGGNSSLNAAEQSAVRASRVTLTIEPGVNMGYNIGTSLIVTRGGLINANGTATAPITMSGVDAGFDGSGEWGGVIIQGFAPQTAALQTADCSAATGTCNVAGEGGTFVGFFGGGSVTDTSGVFRYVRLTEGGQPTATVGDEINGLTLQGVGFGTTIEFVQVDSNLDDAFEWFGGTVNAKYLVATNFQDDAIDFDEGYEGNMQHVLVIAPQDQAFLLGDGNNNNGIEANSGGSGSVIQTEATLANFTIISGGASGSAASVGSFANGPGAVDLRGDVTINMFNSVIDNHDFCVEADNGNANSTILSFSNVLCDSIMGFANEGDSGNPGAANLTFVNSGDVDGVGFIANGGLNSGTVTGGGTGITFGANLGTEQSVASNLPLSAISVSGQSSDFTFDVTNYAGAVNPNASFNPVTDGTPNGVWWAGWTFPGTVIQPITADPAGAGRNLGNIDNGTFTGPAASCVEDFTMTPSATVSGAMEIGGRICNSVTLAAGTEYIVTDNIFVGGGNSSLNAAEQSAVRASRVTLTIEPGVNMGYNIGTSLIVTRGGLINANGTATAPITMSGVDAGFDGSGEWGGVIIQGFAPQTAALQTADCSAATGTCNVAGEGGTFVGFFGGGSVTDTSGVFRYVRLTEGGQPTATVGDEINGLTLQGVGFGTTIEFVQVDSNLDDAFEWFGGTVNAKYLVATNFQDDAIDFDEGYEGNMQHVLVIAPQDQAFLLGDGNNNNGIEANSGGSGSVIQTEATLANFTIISGGASGSAASVGSFANGPGAVDLRGDVTINMFNSVIDNHDFCVEADNGNANSTILSFSNVLCDSIMGFANEGDSGNPGAANLTFVNSGDVDGVGALANGGLNSGSVANGNNGITFDTTLSVNEVVAANLNLGVVTPSGTNFTFDVTDYAGAVDPDATFSAATDGTPNGVWWAGWTFPGTVIQPITADPAGVGRNLGNVNN